MNSLRQLIDKGVAPMRTTYWGKATAETKPTDIASNMARYYNNMYGTITNTHMDIAQDGFSMMITGSLLANNREWAKFECSKFYLGVEFELPFCEWLDSIGYTRHLSVVNGQIVMLASPAQPREDLSKLDKE